MQELAAQTNRITLSCELAHKADGPWYYLRFACGKLWIQIPLCPFSVEENNALVDRCTEYSNHSAQPFHAVPAGNGIVTGSLLRTLQAWLAMPSDLNKLAPAGIACEMQQDLNNLRANNAMGAELFDALTMQSCCVQCNDLPN